MPTSNLPTLTGLDHPPNQHKLSLLRDPHTGTRNFKQLVTLVSPILRAGRGGDRP
jgi:uracil phosphoribosyltransferase